MEIDYFSETRKYEDQIDLYKKLNWYNLPGYTDEEIEKATKNSFYSVYAYDGYTLVGLGRVASDGLTAAVMSGICVRPDYRRRGIGEEIVKRLVYHCQSGSYQMNVQLFCEDSLRHWYKKQGFEDYNLGMRKCMVFPEDPCKLRKGFREIYGIEQITDICSDFYWYNFDAFGEFKYSETLGTDGELVPSVFMTFYSEDPVKFKAEIDFLNVSEFQIGCKGVTTPLTAFDIVNTESLGYSRDKRYRIRSLEDDNISFFCESFHIVNVIT
ncbi:MAG: GNAT family N-acetyltransferase [Oscillospiraceae bacterium]